jgi:uncharacterized protein (DUF1778 family)/GNAT superfamily N-acetyltransferase
MTPATQRLEVRVSPAEKASVARAAEVVGVPMSRFVREAVQERAEIVLSRLHSFTRLEGDLFDDLVRGLDNRVCPSEALQKTWLRRQALPVDRPRVLVTERLAPVRHRVATFTCTNDSLNEWLRYEAADQQHLERCFVWCSRGYDEVDAFYTLTGHRLVREATGSPEADIPAIFVSRLAVDWGNQQTGKGSLLLADALRRAMAASEVDGARFVVAEADNDDAIGFYEHHGFRRIPETGRLTQRVVDIAAALGG